MTRNLRAITLVTLLAFISTFSFAQGTINFTSITPYVIENDLPADALFTAGTRTFKFNFNNALANNYKVTSDGGEPRLAILNQTAGDMLTITDNSNPLLRFSFNSFIYRDFYSTLLHLLIKGFKNGVQVTTDVDFDPTQAADPHSAQLVDLLALDPGFANVDRVEITGVTDGGGIGGLKGFFDDFNITNAGSINTTGTPGGLTTTYGTASAESSFGVGASGLLGDLTVTAPTGFEVSLTSGVGYATAVTMAASATGDISGTTVWLRLSAIAAVNSYSSSVIDISAAGAPNATKVVTTSTVTAAPLTITTTAVSKVYGITITGTAGSATFTATGFKNGDNAATVDIVYGTGASSNDHVGVNSTITMSNLAGGSFTAGNYDIVYQPANITVTAAPLSITATDNTNKPYGTPLLDAAGSTAFISSGLQNGETIGTVSLAYNAGFTATASVRTYGGAIIPSTPTGGDFDPTNYSITYGKGNLTVTAVALSITASNTTKVYGTVLTPGSSSAFASTGLVNNETIGTVSLSYSNGFTATANATTYAGAVVASTATGGSFSPSNYTITYTPGDVIITAAALSITASNTTKIYGTTLTSGASSAAFTSTGLKNGETIATVTLGYTSGNAGADTVGSYTSVITPTTPTGGTFNASNYTITLNPGNLTVTQAPLSVTAIPGSKTFGTAFTTVSGSSSFSISGLQNLETALAVNLTYSPSAGVATAAVGSYTNTIVPSGLSTGTFTPSNYTITYNPAILVVTPAPLTITAAPVSKIYGTTLTTVAGSASFSTTGLVNADAITGVTITYVTGSAGNAGVTPTYSTSVTPSAPTGNASFLASNYTITPVPAALTIVAKQLTITGGATKAFGQTLTSSASTFGFTVTGLVNSETLSSVTTNYSSGNANTDAVGTYTNGVTPALPIFGTLNTANYAIAFVTGDVVVIPVTLTIIPAGIIKPYGVTVTGTAGYTQFTSTGLRNSDVIASVTAAFGAGAAASATVAVYTGTTTLSAPVAGGTLSFTTTNYSIVYATGPIQVVPFTVTITANDVTKSYGTPITGGAGSAAFTTTALANSETITSVTITYGTGATANGTVGTHTGTITPSLPTGTITASNYTFVYVTGSIIVTAVPLTITANPVAKTYGTVLATGSSSAFTSTGLKNGETIGSVTLTYGPGGAGNASVTGSYPADISPSAASGGTFTAGNYAPIAYVPAGITVTATPLTITATDIVKPFGTALTNQAGYQTFTSSGLMNGEIIPSVTVAYGTGAASTATAGSYPNSIVLSSAAAGGAFTPTNYSIGYVAGAILIGDPTLSVGGTITAMTTTYGTASAGVSFAISGTNVITGGILITPPTGFEVSSTSSTTGFSGTITVGSTGNIPATPIYIRLKATTFVGAYSGTVTVSTSGVTSLTLTVSSGTVSTTPLTITSLNAAKEYGTSLTPGPGSIRFSANGLKNGENIGSVTVSYGSANAALSPVGNYALQAIVSSATGGTFTASNYAINYVGNQLSVTPSTNAKLSALTVSAGTLNPAFTGTTTSYTLQVGNLVTAITLTPTVAINASTIKVNGVTLASGTVSNSLSLITGDNIVSVAVTAQIGGGPLTYTIVVNREKSSNANLTTLASSVTYTPTTFTPNTQAYAASVANSVTSVTLTPTVTDATATVTVNGITVTSGTAATVNLAVGTNTITTLVTAENGTTTKAYVLTVTRPASTNANLFALVMGSGTLTPAFATDTLRYSLSVATSVSLLSFTPTVEDPTATVKVVGSLTTGAGKTVNLGVGLNQITVLVTAQDGVTTKSYVLMVTRAPSGNAFLSGLEISTGSFSIPFTGTTLGYKLNVSNGTTSMTLTPTVSDAGASIQVNGVSVTSGASSQPIALAVGSNLITIAVKAADLTINNYTISVTRDLVALSSNANLSGLTISSGTLAPAFSGTTTAYTVTVSDAATSITLTPTAAEVSAEVKVNGVVVTSGSSIAVSLPDDVNTVTIKMTAQDGTAKTYVIAVNKLRTTWKGVITGGSWTESANWTNGVPDATKLAVIGQSNISPVVSGTVTAGSLNIAAGVVITITGNLQVTGNVVNAGTFTGTGVVTCTGAATQTFSGTGNINNLTINNPTRVSIAPGSGNTMSLAGVLTVSQGVFSTGNNLVLLSTAATTASVAAMPLSTSIDGQVTAQRWITGQRGYRGLGHPFNGVLQLNQLTDNFDITGNGAGFKIGLGSTGPSAYYFDSLAIGAGQQPLSIAPNAAATPLWSVSRGILVMIRGKGSEGLPGYSSDTQPTAFAADVTGTLNQGTLADYKLGANATGTSYNLVGNPYAASINLKLLKSNSGLLSANNGASGVSNTIYVFNPRLNAGIAGSPVSQQLRGGFDAYTNDGSTDIIIPSFGTFFVTAKAPGNVLKFDESVKAVGGTPLALLGGGGNAKVSKLTLQVENSMGSWDELKLRWESNGTALGTDNYDGLKMNNDLFDLYSIATDNRQLTIDSRSNSFSSDQVIPLGIRTSVVDKTFRFKVSNYDLPSDVTVYLHDKLLNKEELLHATGDTYSFELTADTATGGNNRFELVIKATQKTITPVTGDVASEEDVRFMPNPFKETLSIRLGGNMVSSTGVTRVRLLDMNGHPVKTASYAPNTSQIQMNTADISVGIYLVEISNDKNTVIKKAIKQ